MFGGEEMNVIEAKIYLLQAPGVNRVLDSKGNEIRANSNGEFECQFTNLRNQWLKISEMYCNAPFTKVEPERGNLLIAVDIAQGNMPEATTILEILDVVDDKIRRAKL